MLADTAGTEWVFCSCPAAFSVYTWLRKAKGALLKIEAARPVIDETTGYGWYGITIMFEVVSPPRSMDFSSALVLVSYTSTSKPAL